MNIFSQLIEARTYAFYAMMIVAILLVVLAVIVLVVLLSRRRNKGGHIRNGRSSSTRHRNYDDF